MHKRKEVEEKTRESVLGRLAELKKERNLRTAKKTVGAKKAKRTGTGLGFSLERQ